MCIFFIVSIFIVVLWSIFMCTSKLHTLAKLSLELCYLKYSDRTSSPSTSACRKDGAEDCGLYPNEWDWETSVWRSFWSAPPCCLWKRWPFFPALTWMVWASCQTNGLCHKYKIIINTYAELRFDLDLSWYIDDSTLRFDHLKVQSYQNNNSNNY